jgi:hypothetical protein
MGFTSSPGVLGVCLRTRALQGSGHIGFFQVAGDKSFFRQKRVYEALEKQARNKAYQADIKRLTVAATGFL